MGRKTATVTTVTFKRIKDFVLALKKRQTGMLLLSSAPAPTADASDPGWSFTMDEMMTAVGHLETMAMWPLE